MGQNIFRLQEYAFLVCSNSFLILSQVGKGVGLVKNSGRVLVVYGERKIVAFDCFPEILLLEIHEPQIIPDIFRKRFEIQVPFIISYTPFKIMDPVIAVGKIIEDAQLPGFSLIGFFKIFNCSFILIDILKGKGNIIEDLSNILITQFKCLFKYLFSFGNFTKLVQYHSLQHINFVVGFGNFFKLFNHGKCLLGFSLLCIYLGFLNLQGS